MTGFPFPITRTYSDVLSTLIWLSLGFDSRFLWIVLIECGVKVAMIAARKVARMEQSLIQFTRSQRILQQVQF